MRPGLSVLVPVYNGAALLPACVDSILAQTMPDFELLILNDGSSDESGAIAEAYAARDARVRVLHRENGGLSSARNALIAQASGTWLSFIDADDWVEPTYLAYLQKLRNRFGARMAACNHYIEVRGAQTPCFPEGAAPALLSTEDAYRGLLYHRPPDVSAWGKLYHRDVFEGLSYPDGRLFEDSYLIAALLRQAGGVAMGLAPQYHYRYLGTSLSKLVAPAHQWDYLDAVTHMIEEILPNHPDCAKGCTRRLLHAALSTKRIRVKDTPQPDFTRANEIIRKGAWAVLRDPQAPVRDKLGILTSFLGEGVYRGAWALYEKARGRG